MKYLHVGQVHTVLLKETNKFFKVFFSWEIVTAIWPNSLKRARKISSKKQIKLK